MCTPLSLSGGKLYVCFCVLPQDGLNGLCIKKTSNNCATALYCLLLFTSGISAMHADMYVYVFLMLLVPPNSYA